MGRSDVILDAVACKLIFFGTLCALAWNGHALEAIFLWWLPRQIDLIYILFFLSWAPHHPAEEKGRCRNTRSWRSKLGNVGSLGMQFHLIHRFYPTIPLTRHPAVYVEMKPILEARGRRLGDLRSLISRPGPPMVRAAEYGRAVMIKKAGEDPGDHCGDPFGCRRDQRGAEQSMVCTAATDSGARNPI